MTRKDYVAIAAALARTRPQSTDGQTVHLPTWTATRDAIADVMAADNPRFDRPRFIRATEA